MPITAGTVLGLASGNDASGNLDSDIYPVTLPFNFIFNGAPQNTINVSTNGFITFGSVAPATTYTLPISGTTPYDGAVAAWGRNINTVFDVNGKTGEISWETLGVAPNREIVIQWKNFRPNSSVSNTAIYVFSFQIRLQETSNTIKAVYDSGSYLVGNTAIGLTTQIGLRGSSNLDFNNRLNNVSTAFTNSSPGTANNSQQAFNTTNILPGMPPTGFTYIWTPPSCYTPKGFSIDSYTTNTASISWPVSSSNPGGYDIYYSTNNTPPTSTTVPSYQNVPGTSYVIDQLAALTKYYVWVRSNCSAGNESIWIQNPVEFTTLCTPSSVLSTMGATVCPGQPATLNATAATGITLNWYDAQTGGNLLNTGNSYTTSALAVTTNYYVGASTGEANIAAGKDIFNNSPSNGSGTTNVGLVFDALSFFRLQSVTIYPTSSTGASGSVTIDVINGDGDILHTKTENVVGSHSSSPVAHVVNLDFGIFPGTNYKLRMRNYTGISGLLFDPSANAPGGTGGNYGYPFTVPNVLSINTSTLTVAPTNTPRNDLYYYFYDWKISTRCESARTLVTATVDSNCLSTLEADAKEVIKVYPNPFLEVININKPELVKSIKITDVSGKLIRNVNQPESTLRLQDLSQGMYILILEMKNGVQQSIKVIKK